MCHTNASTHTNTHTHNATQPKNYLDYISTYRRLLQGQRRANEDMTARLTGAGRRLLQHARLSSRGSC